MRIHRVGDPHLGKVFTNGVPLHRRGEREAMQLAEFRKQLNKPNIDYNVMMGDIFDKAIVSPTIVLQTYESYLQAMVKHPTTTFVLIKGNHDITRDTTKNSSFDLLAGLLRGYHNIRIVDSFLYEENLLFIAYDPFVDTVTLTQGIIDELYTTSFTEVFGHWDIISYGGDDHNLLPYEVLSKVTDNVSTGHIHIPEVFEKEGLTIKVVGSLQPFSHAEDPKGELYLTKTIPEYEEASSEYTNKCLRLLMAPEESVPEDIDCLQLGYKSIASDEQETLEVEMEDFSFKGLLFECLADNNVPEDERDLVWETYKESEE